MEKSATISPCGKYRYLLRRKWDESLQSLTFVMLNPSTADADLDDPTIRRCMAFARREGYGGIAVLNLFAFRATDPKALFSADDAVGVENEAHLHMAVTAAGSGATSIICAWGAHPAIGSKAMFFRQYARTLGVTLHCLGKTKHGAPRHPLYVKGDQPLEVYP